jgi:hypothetical protein
MGFYDFQFGFLATICICLQLFEHYLTREAKPRAEAGSAAREAASGALMRKYLVVYGLVMCASPSYVHHEIAKTSARCRLAPGSVCVFALCRAIRLSGTYGVYLKSL